MPHAALPPFPPRPGAISTQERVLLSAVPPEHREHLLRLLRSPDRTVRGMALVLIFLDRDATERHP
jgi:hypothetical protein